MKQARYLYSLSATLVLLITLAGFWPFYLAGEGMQGRKISPQLFPLVAVHGTAMTAWVILFLVQSLLISSRNRKTHMKLGWSAIVITTIIAFTGSMVAVESVRSAPNIPFWGMQYRQFLLIMLAEIMLFTTFVLAGILIRRRPEIHRAMMLLASLSILAGATVRMPILFGFFGRHGWVGIFGPIFCLGAVFLIARCVLNRAADKWFAAGYAAMIAVYVAASAFAVSDTWSLLAKAIFST